MDDNQLNNIHSENGELNSEDTAKEPENVQEVPVLEEENSEQVSEEKPEEGSPKEPTPEEIKAARKKKVLKEVREWVTSILAAFLIVFVIRFFLFTIIKVDGSSMETTLHSGERLFVTVADVKFGNGIERGDVVICHYPNRGWTNFVKRVVAVPGDTIYRENGVTHVVYSVEEDGATKIYDEALAGSGSRTDMEKYVLGEGEYFVVGDNRTNSHDSRSDDVGVITKSMIVGHVRYVIWPLSDIREVE